MPLSSDQTPQALTEYEERACGLMRFAVEANAGAAVSPLGSPPRPLDLRRLRVPSCCEAVGAPAACDEDMFGKGSEDCLDMPAVSFIMRWEAGDY